MSWRRTQTFRCSLLGCVSGRVRRPPHALLGEEPVTPPKDVRDLDTSPQETKPRDSLGMSIVERPKCGSLVTLQVWVLGALQRAARDIKQNSTNDDRHGLKAKMNMGGLCGDGAKEWDDRVSRSKGPGC